jgi:hypothetical protein
VRLSKEVVVLGKQTEGQHQRKRDQGSQPNHENLKSVHSICSLCLRSKRILANNPAYATAWKKNFPQEFFLSHEKHFSAS